jgi:SH3-like domain-containing protein
VPRWVSLKFDKVNARAGPGDDHRLLWVYRVKNLPFRWCRRPPTGGASAIPTAAWPGCTSAPPTENAPAMNLRVADMPLRARAGEDGRPRAFWVQRSLGSLDECSGGWCRVKVGGVSGWAPRNSVWGVQEAAVCGRRR